VLCAAFKPELQVRRRLKDKVHNRVPSVILPVGQPVCRARIREEVQVGGWHSSDPANVMPLSRERRLTLFQISSLVSAVRRLQRR